MAGSIGKGLVEFRNGMQRVQQKHLMAAFAVLLALFSAMTIVEITRLITPAVVGSAAPAR